MDFLEVLQETKAFAFLQYIFFLILSNASEGGGGGTPDGDQVYMCPRVIGEIKKISP